MMTQYYRAKTILSRNQTSVVQSGYNDINYIFVRVALKIVRLISDDAMSFQLYTGSFTAICMSGHRLNSGGMTEMMASIIF